MEVAKAGGTAEKFISAGRRPDRIVTWTSPLLDFVELKAPGEKPTPGQLRDHGTASSAWVFGIGDRHVKARLRAHFLSETSGRRDTTAIRALSTI
jgi:hypothetical protein